MTTFLRMTALAAIAILLCLSAVLRAADSELAPAAQREPISGSREMLRLYGVDDSYLRAFADARPLGPDEEESLWRTLFAVRRFAVSDIDRWARRQITIEQLAADPDKYRGEIIELSGRVKRVQIEKPLAEVVERFSLPKFYRCELAVGEQKSPATVYTLAVPKAWQIGKPLDERCSVQGVFIKLAGEEQRPVDPVLASQRIAWYPENELGDLGMDVGLYEEISPRAELAAEDRECFYQLLAAAGRAGAQELLRRTPGEYRVAPLFNQPERQQGKLVALQGTARQCLLRRVEDPDIIARFGIDHYFEIEMDTLDSQNNPITFCVRELPPGFPQGERILEGVRIPGFFFKKWGYRLHVPGGAETEREGLVRRQLAPLLIGRQPLWLKPEKFDSGRATWAFVVLFVIGMAVLWLIVWRLNHSDDRFHDKVVRKAIAQPEIASLNELGLEDAGPPDFRDHGSPS